MDARTVLSNIPGSLMDEPTAQLLSSHIERQRTKTTDFTEPGTVKVATDLVASETPAAPSQTEAVTDLVTAEVPAPHRLRQPSSNSTFASRTSGPQPMPKLPVSLRLHQTQRSRPTPTPMPLLLPQSTTIAIETTRTVADAAMPQDPLLRLMASTTGPRASPRSPNKNRERNQ